MKKRLLLIAIAALFASPSHGAAQGEISAILSSGIAPNRQALEGFREAVRERKGSVRTDEHFLDKEGGDAIVQRILAEKSAMVFAVGPDAAWLAKERLRNMPVVFAMVLNPNPLLGQNVTGVSLEIPARVKLEKIRKFLPDARRVGVIYSKTSLAQYRDVVQGCKALGLQAVGREVESGKEFPKAFGEMAQQMDLFLMLPDTKVFFPKSIEYLLVEALKNKVPVIGLAASYTRAGALFSFEADYRDVGRQAGVMAVKIIEGGRSANIEPAAPRRIKSSVNLAVAGRLGIMIDPQVIREASEVFR